MRSNVSVRLTPYVIRTAGLKYQGRVLMSSSEKVDTAWRCPHRHNFEDCALHCAGVQSRRMQREQA